MITTLKRTVQWTNLGLLGLLSKKTSSKKAETLIKEQLSHNLSQMRGGASKMNQAMEMMKSSYGNGLKPKAVKAMPLKQIKKLLSQNPLHPQVSKIHSKAYPASMGQVHKCTLKDGKELAIKFIYPELLKYVNADQKLIDQLFKTFKTSSNFNQKSYQAQLWQELRTEIDLLNELETINTLSPLFQELLPSWIFPKAHKEFSTHNILVMDWIEHSPLLEKLTDLTVTKQNDLMKDLANLFLGGLSRYGCMHADLNPGNLGIHPSGKFVLLDFGSVWKPQEKEKLFFLELLHSIQTKQNPIEILENIGFNTIQLQEIKPLLPEFLKIQLQPFLTTTPLSYPNWKRKEKTEKLLPPQNRWDFMTSAPSNYFLFLRAMSGFIFWWKISGSSISLSQISDDWINKLKHQFHLSKTQKKQTQITSPNKLRIEVNKNSGTEVTLNFEVKLLADLQDLMGDDLYQKVINHGIEFDSILNQAYHSNFEPQTLFEINDSDAKVKVSITQ